MKYFLILILSFNLFGASYMPISKVGDCSYHKTATNIKYCEGSCILIPSDYNCETHTIQKEVIDDLESPIYSKNQTNKCGEYCETLFPELVCEDTEETPILNTDLEEIYCSKVTGYNKKESGFDVVLIDIEKEAVFKQKEQKLQQMNEKIANGEAARKKSSDALAYIAGATEGSTEEEADAMAVSFGEIYQALNNRRTKKALRLIQEDTQEGYEELKEALIEILK